MGRKSAHPSPCDRSHGTAAAMGVLVLGIGPARLVKRLMPTEGQASFQIDPEWVSLNRRRASANRLDC